MSPDPILIKLGTAAASASLMIGQQAHTRFSPKRRFRAPWEVRRIEGDFAVADSNGFRPEYVYAPQNFDELGTAAVGHLSDDEARGIAAGDC